MTYEQQRQLPKLRNTSHLFQIFTLSKTQQFKEQIKTSVPIEIIAKHFGSSLSNTVAMVIQVVLVFYLINLYTNTKIYFVMIRELEKLDQKQFKI